MSSNMIKAYSIAYDKEKIKTLDFEDRENKIAQRLKELLPTRPMLSTAAEEPSGFVQGLPAEDLGDVEFVQEQEQTMVPAVDVDAMRQSLREEIMAEMSPILQRKGDDIIANARAQASGLIEASRQEAENAKDGILKAASAQGYEEGKKRAKAEEDKLKAEYAAKMQQLEQEYNRRFAEMEPAFANILTELVKKLTNVAYDSHKEVLSYLIETGLGFAQKDTSFDVLLSEADYQKYEELFPEIKEQFKDKFVLDFKKNAALPDGSCKLENENRVIDCGLGIRLSGLLEELSLLGA